MNRGLFVLLMLLHAAAALAAKPPYEYYRLGNPAEVDSAPEPGVVLMGGSTDVDAAFQWMCDLADGGDFVVIRARGTDAYNPYIQAVCPEINSVATLIIPSMDAAELPAVENIILNAEAIWIAGGDQSLYVNYWSDTRLQDALQVQIDNGVPIGGTSAGLNVLTQFIYTAEANKGVASSQALADPFNRYMSFDRDFVKLPVLAGVIGDPHFAARDRLGRDLAFLCRIYDNAWSDQPKGIAVDERTALLIEPKTGLASVVGEGSAYFLATADPPENAPEVCASKTPLTYTGIRIDRIEAASGSFDLPKWTLKQGGSTFAVSAIDGILEGDLPY